MLTFVCKDRNFLKRTAGILSEKDFQPRKGEGNLEFEWIAAKAYQYWRDYKDPIGGLLRTEMLDFVSKHKNKVGAKHRERLFEIVDRIRKADGLVAVEAVEQKVIEYKESKAMGRSIQEMIDKKEKGELTKKEFYKICKKALDFHDNTIRVSDYTEDIDKRIERRRKNRNRKFPALLIDQFDRNVRSFPRGEIAIGLARYKTGKSTFATHLAQAYSLQGYKVLLFTLEDNVDMVEDRLDANFAGVRLKNLYHKSDKVKRHLRRAFKELRGRIKIVDGTDGGMSVERIDEIWEKFRNQGFDAHVVIIDYDEGINAPEHYKGDSGETREMKDIYKSLKNFASKRDIWLWVMAQTRRGKGKRKTVVTGDDAANDISKIKRCAMCIGIGDGPKDSDSNTRYFNVAVHRYDKMGIGWPIVGDFDKAVFYDRDKTEKYLKTYKPEKEE